MPANWPFAVPPGGAALTTARVLDGHPVLLVTHDRADGGWEFLCGTTDQAIAVRDVEMSRIVDNDPSLRELADLPVGWRAWRASPGEPWQRGPLGFGP
jgi:hypothetical protein